MKDLLLKAHFPQDLNIRLQAPDSVYFMGICGTAMASLALYLKQNAFEVSGSDQNIYPPMSLELKKARIPVFNYNAGNISNSIKLIIVGNVISTHHPELLEAKKKQIPIISFPEFLRDALLSKTKNIVIAGTHGKSTCSALTAFVAKKAKQNPSFFIGARPKDFSSSLRSVDSDFFILEGDEYDSSFFLKQPKFFYYNPFSVLLTGVELDHGDIYKNVNQIKTLFCQFVKKIPKKAFLVACAEDSSALEISQHCKAPVITYGFDTGDWRIKNRTVEKAWQNFEIYGPGESYSCSISLLGKHNALNALGVFVLAKNLNWPVLDILAGLKSFKGLYKRLEFKYEFQAVKIFEDFAHHPTAIKAGLSALKESYPHQRLLAFFEPRSFTSRLNLFQTDYVSAFSPSDLVFIGPIYNSCKIPKEKRLSVEKLVQDLRKQGKEAFCYKNFQDLLEDCKKKIKANDIVVFMSSGNFGDILKKL